MNGKEVIAMIVNGNLYDQEITPEMLRWNRNKKTVMKRPPAKALRDIAEVTWDGARVRLQLTDEDAIIEARKFDLAMDFIAYEYDRNGIFYCYKLGDKFPSSQFSWGNGSFTLVSNNVSATAKRVKKEMKDRLEEMQIETGVNFSW